MVKSIIKKREWTPWRLQVELLAETAGGWTIRRIDSGKTVDISTNDTRFCQWHAPGVMSMPVWMKRKYFNPPPVFDP